VIDVFLDLSPEGLLRGFRALGHAEGAVGSNIACAAVTTLLRTAARLCAERGIVEDGEASGPGEMRVVLSRRAEGVSSGWLGGVTEFLLRGLGDLQGEYPGEVAMRIAQDGRSLQ
jgi:uncharacterized protein YsxB (DUF464 family)